MTILKYPENFILSFIGENCAGITPCCLKPSRIFANSVVALGFFDGVHLGHRALIETAKNEAKKRGVLFGVFTFESEGTLKSGSERIYTTSDRLDLIASLGADYAVVADFDSVKNLSPKMFVDSVITGAIGASVAVSGYNFRFGKDASGTAGTLSELMRDSGGEAIIIDDVKVDGATVSSTSIRKSLAAGDIDTANRMLVTPYFISGSIVHGDKRGKTLGYPTINIPIRENYSRPKRGVYAVSIVADGKCYTGIANVGICPTFEERIEHIECYIFNFSGEIYGMSVKLHFLKFIREEKSFRSSYELASQIERDIAFAKSVFTNNQHPAKPS